MDFDFTDDQVALRDAVARWAARSFTFARRHAAAKAGGGSRDVWRELADLGLTGLAVDESHGGLGLGPVDAMVVMEELGRALVHAPFAEAALATPRLLLDAPTDLAAAWLPRIAAGDALVVPAWLERGSRWAWARPRTTCRRDAAGAWTVRGHKGVVPAADEADAFLVTATREPAAPDAPFAVALLLVEAKAPGVEVHAYPTQDGARAGEVRLHDAPAQLVAADARAAFSHALDITLAAHAAEGVGAMDALLALTVDYLNTRRQFNAPLASFQALRHRVAEVKMAVELARSMSYYATLKLTAPEPERRRALSQAKVQVGRSLRTVGQQCTQLHGGIGVTDEYVGSHYFKRLTMLEQAEGDTLHHLGEVVARMTEEAGVGA